MRFLSILLFLWASIDLIAQNFEVVRLSSDINTSLEEISPILLDDGQTLLFTRIGSPDFNQTLIEEGVDLSKNLPKPQFLQRLSMIFSSIAGKNISDPTTSRFNQDIYIAKHDGMGFSDVKHPESPLNNALPNSVCSATPDPDVLIITNQFVKEGGMSAGFSTIKRNVSGGFEFPKAIEIDDFYTYSEEVGFSMAPDGNAIIMSLDRDDTYGGLDLYVSFRINDHHFTAPTNLGPVINTKYREIAPYVSKDNNRLFFASNRTPNRSFDIFTASRQAYSWIQWAELKKLPEPINSAFDDSQPFFVEKTDELFFISNREGNSDIYKVGLTPKIKPEKEVAIKGVIIDATTQKPVRAMLNYGPVKEENPPNFFNSFTGDFKVNLIFKDNYKFSAKKNNYFSSEIVLDPDQFADIKSNYEMVIELYPINKTEFIQIGSLNFKQSKSSLMANSTPELDRLYRILKQNNKLEIRIEGHTDNIGDGGAKESLSEARANTIKQYLIDKGISARRIDTKGYGDSRPLNTNETEAERRANRRVEVRIINKNKNGL